MNLRCDVVLFPRGAARPSTAGSEYPTMLLLEQWCDPSKVIDLITTASEGLGDIAGIKVKFNKPHEDSPLARDALPPLLFGCPVYRVRFPFAIGCPVEDNRLIARGVPYYRNGYAAIQDWCEGEHDGARALGTILVSLPQCRARLDHLSVDDQGLQITVSGDAGTLARAMIKGQASSLTHAVDIEILDLVVGVPRAVALPDDPRAIELYLVDGSGEVLDRHVETPGGNEPARGRLMRDMTRTARDEALVRNAIESGENERVEFKPYIRPGDTKMREVYETVVALANTNGGVLVIGIDDYCEILGVEHDLVRAGKGATTNIASLVEGYVAEMRKRIREALNRTPDLRASTVEIANHTMIAFFVASGGERPYALRGSNAVFVRRGPNNVAPHPDHELRQLLAAEPSRPWDGPT